MPQDTASIAQVAKAWSTATKWVLGGIGGLVALGIVAGGNFILDAVWEKVLDNIVIAAKAASTEEVNEKIKALIATDVQTQTELGNVQSTLKAVADQQSATEAAVKENTAIGKKVLQLLIARPTPPTSPGPTQ